MLRLLTQRFEAKAELSTYFIKFHNAGQSYASMMERLCSIIDDNCTKRRFEELVHNYKEIEQSVMWEWITKHVKTSKVDSSHFCTFALRGHCPHIHLALSCSRCCTMMNYFNPHSGPVAFGNRSALSSSNANFRQEFESMQSAIPRYLETLIQYLGYNIRAKLEFEEFDRTK